MTIWYELKKVKVRRPEKGIHEFTPNSQIMIIFLRKWNWSSMNDFCQHSALQLCVNHQLGQLFLWSKNPSKKIIVELPSPQGPKSAELWNVTDMTDISVYKSKCHSIRHQTPKFPTPQNNDPGWLCMARDDIPGVRGVPGGPGGHQGCTRGRQGRLGYSRRQNEW